MARNEEIKQAAQAYYPKGTLHEEKAVSAFIRGAKWADKTIVEKACKYLKEKNKICMYELEMILGNKFINEFKKAMEEQL